MRVSRLFSLKLRIMTLRVFVKNTTFLWNMFKVFSCSHANSLFHFVRMLHYKTCKFLLTCVHYNTCNSLLTCASLASVSSSTFSMWDLLPTRCRTAWRICCLTNFLSRRAISAGCGCCGDDWDGCCCCCCCCSNKLCCCCKYGCPNGNGAEWVLPSFLCLLKKIRISCLHIYL